MSHKEKIVLIGAGSLQFGLGSAGSILESNILKGSTVCLHDINPESLKLVDQACRLAVDKEKLDFTIESTTNRPDALKGATFIINSIEAPPRFELWDQDYDIPRKFGNKQVMGENGGPGGFFHSLRVIPPILEICEDVKKICPNAYFLNFSNPMSRICLAIKRKFPSLKTVGLCHEYYHHVPIISRILKTPVSNLEIKAGGLNHFGVILDIRYRDTGKDAYPDIRKNGPEYLRSITTIDGHEIMVYILEKYGYIPYTTDSHYGEYIHWAWEIADMDGIRNFKTVYRQSIEYVNNRITKLIQRGKGYRLVKKDEEKAIPIIEGILTNSNYMEASVNLPNDDVISNLPIDLIVECPAIVNKDGLQAVKLGEYPKGLAALLKNQASVQVLVVEAILTKSKELALQALLANPVVDSYTQAEKMLDEMLRIQSSYIQLE